MKVAYCPFDDNDTVNLVQFNISKFHRRTLLEKFDQRVRRHNGLAPVLRDVSYKQQLYVFGHGSPMSDVIEDCQGNQITIGELALRMFLDGLSMSHEKIKLHSCSGGVGGHYSMAAKLKMALQALGFLRLNVYGYTEDLSVSTSGPLGFKRTVTGARAKSTRVRF